ncbi:MAG: glycosyltransferase, partial [Thermodesulfovibrionales bacterium]
MNKEDNQTIVIVMGMHRSGTSLVTNILSKAGYFLGSEDDLMKGTEANRDGYFERWSVVKTNELVLNLCGGRWDLPPDEKDILRTRIDPRIEILLGAYKGHDKIVIKDPRISLTFPVWQSVLGRNIRIVNIVREPDAVAASLMKRDGFTREKGLALWDIYTKRALKYSKDYPAYSIQYEDLFGEKREDILRELSSFLGIHTDLEEIACSVVDRTLDHYRSNLQGRQLNSRRLSIITPVYNKIEYTKKCLAAIRGNTPDELYEIIIIDNASTDGTKDFLKSLAEDVRIISNEKNLGFAKACNQGASISSSEYILFLNNDTEPMKGWLEPLAAVLDNDASVAAVGSKLIYPDGTIQHGGIILVDDRKNKDPLLAKNNFVGMPANAPEANEATLYQALTAACLAVRKSAFTKAGGFDEGYWNGYEDVDLCFKLKMQGNKFVYEPRSVVVHHESKSGKERFSKAAENIARLHNKWIGKIGPDMVLCEDGTIKLSDAGEIHSYKGPLSQECIRKQPPFSPKQRDLISIVILTFNQLEHTKECVGSIRKHTPEPHEIIFVDNGSKDGTVQWLKKLVKENANYNVIENGTNFGFSKGCNQGISAAKGDFILLLNNDVVVTGNWMSGMLECCKSAHDVGIVGPMTNSISGPQKVEDVGYTSLKQLDEYAKRFRDRRRYRRIPLRRIVGFCMLFRRELSDKIGQLDENFGTGNYEDDDYCLRAALAGYRNIIAGDVFIHHYGSASFIGNNINYRSAMSGNRKTYKAKWGVVKAGSPLGKNLIVVQALEKAEELCGKDKAETAISVLIDAIKYSPDDLRIYQNLAKILLELKEYPQALDVIDRMPPDDRDPDRLCLAGYCKEGL